MAEVNGINLSNYYRDPYSTNPVIYIHKRHLNQESTIPTENDMQYKKDKYQQHDYNEQNANYEVNVINKNNEDPVVEQTIKFAKEIIPLTIPPDTNIENSTYYTIKTSKKAKRKHEILHHHHKDVTFDKEKSKSMNEKCKHFKRDNLSTTETSIPCSQNNTLDDVNDNRSLCCSLSELSERKCIKKERCRLNKRYDAQRMVASESLEAIATEFANTSNENAIKIHLMNDREKKALIENIQLPLIKAVKECVFESNTSTDVQDQLHAMKTTVDNNSIMLESILDKLSNLEKKIECFCQESTLIPKHGHPNHKASKLEELGEDLLDTKEDLSSEEELTHVNLVNKNKERNDIVPPIHLRNDNDSLGRGDKVSNKCRPSTSQVGVKTDTQNRMPMRFCWTDAKIN